MKAKLIAYYHRLKPIGLLFVPNIKTVVLLYVLLMILLKRHTANTFVVNLIGDYLIAFHNLLSKDCVANRLTTFAIIVCAGYFAYRNRRYFHRRCRGLSKR